ncbi:hypothetical protein I6J71_05775 [Amycolatopsis sp. FDAARGOS 1241]|nr:hypothetical protein I6J71_05775 [Amycolatopsis sp. FDAARGOS 1241]
MQVILSFALPLATLLLVLVGAWEVRPKKKPSRLKRRLSSTYLDEVTSFLYGTKRTELEHRDSVEMTLEEDAQGAPPLGDIDLDRGVVTLRPGNQDKRSES